MSVPDLPQANAWQQFAYRKELTHYPMWPNEVMVKVVFGSYLKHKIPLSPKMKVLDVGCGFGNNLLPFLVRGNSCYGTEVTKPMVLQTERILKERGFSARIKVGTNEKLPFSNGYFDLLLSINVIHYQGTHEKVKQGFEEYRRVLKPGGHFFLMTVGEDHAIIKKAKRLNAHVFQIQNYDFRNGTHFYCFNTPANLKKNLMDYFSGVEVGRVTEQLMTTKLDFLIATGAKK